MSEMKTLLDEFNDLVEEVADHDPGVYVEVSVKTLQTILNTIKVLVDDHTRWQPVVGFSEINLDEDPAAFLRNRQRLANPKRFSYGL